MKKSLFALFIILSSAALFSGCLEKKTEQTPKVVTPIGGETLSATPDQNMANETTTNFYTLADLESHNQPEDCWFSIEGSVYDVTPYIKGGLHPGEDKILLGCGKDATELYATKAGQGLDHSDKARAYLKSFKIGELKK